MGGNSGILKQPVVVVVELSELMEGALGELQKGLELLQTLLSNPKTATTVELALVTFKGDEVAYWDFSQPGEISIPTLTTGPLGYLGKGVLKGIELIEKRKGYYSQTGQNYSRPIIGLISTGNPNFGDSETLFYSLMKLHLLAEREELLFWGFGVEDPDIPLLKELIPEKPGFLCKKVKEGEGKYLSLFQWLGESLSLLSEGWQVEEVLEEMERRDVDRELFEAF